MLNDIKQYTILLLFLSFLQAEERFIDTSSFSLAHINLSERYCKQFQINKKFCKSKTLNYIDFEDANLPHFLRGLKTHLSPILKEYQKENLKISTLRDIKDLNGEVMGEWYDQTIITLIAKTPTTYTLSFRSNGYSGGAHGYDTEQLNNYAIATQKRLTLQDLLLPDTKQTLYTIAQKHYKETRGLKPSDSLVEDGWFDNKFVLAENFAITPRGLLFYYNSYEIKSYADGHTQFMLPYALIHPLIDPKGVLGYVLQQPNDHTHASYENEQMSLTIDAQYHKDHTVTITAKLQAKNGADKAWLSISLPQIASKKILLGLYGNDFDHTIPYDRLNKIYNVKQKKAIHPKYLLVEADKRHLAYDKNYEMKFKIKVPKDIKNLIINVRATLKRNKSTHTLPSNYEGVTGQQGYKNYNIYLALPH
jgi:hypothetical protein